MLGHVYVLRAFAKTKSVLKANLIRTTISIPIGYFLVKQFGIYGASILFVFSFFLNSILQLHQTQKLLNLKLKDFIPWNDFFKLTLISIFSLVILYTLDILQHFLM